VSSVGYKTTKPAELLSEALIATGMFRAKPVENGCAVRVETTLTRINADVPMSTATIWLPDDEINAGYVWTAPTDHELPADAGMDRVVHALAATLLPDVIL
jgi:hypothetical protein